jgi:catechol 2,3-dioxygenase-like lactoylglutathione lyase family enzyme
MSSSTATASRISTIGLVCVPTADQEKLLGFYVDVLGFEKRTDVPMGPGARWIEVYPPSGNTGIALAPPPPGGKTGNHDTGITLVTDDIDATHAYLKGASADVDDVSRFGDPVPPLCFLRDPEGNSLIVVETQE